MTQKSGKAALMSDSTARVPSRILAIDTALGACAVCVFDGAEGLPIALESEEMATGHAEALMPMIQRVMARVDGGFASLSRVAVSIGPGSFTGLRIGISAARAIGLAAGVPVIGVSTLSAYAAPLVNASESGVIAVAIDARHGALFFQAFTTTGRTIVLPRVLGVKEAGRAIGSGPVKLAGNGAGALAVETITLGLKATLADLRPAPDITAVARLGLIASPESAPARPMYLRPPSAQPQEAKAVARAP
jgi:tRNA threonylcarbamoyladenosine biosynthesis protein TsaB